MKRVLRLSRALELSLLLVSSYGCVGDLGGDPPGAGPGVEDVDAAPSELARLTRVEYERTVTDIFGGALVAGVSFGDLPPDGKVGRFESNVGLNVNIDSIDAYRSIAEQVGAAASPKAATLLGCQESDVLAVFARAAVNSHCVALRRLFGKVPMG